MTLTGVTYDAAGLGISAAAGAWATNANVDAALTELTDAITALRSQAATFGSNLAVVKNRQDFSKSLINTLSTGADNLVLADANEEGAKLVTLQTPPAARFDRSLARQPGRSERAASLRLRPTNPAAARSHPTRNAAARAGAHPLPPFFLVVPEKRMWKPRKLASKNAIVFEPSPHGRRFLTENLYRMAITRISHVFDPAELATSIHQLDFSFVFIDWGHDSALRDKLFTVMQEWSRVREWSQVLVMTTPDARESNLKMAMVLDCDAIILKPYSPRIFCDRCNWAVGRKEAA